MENIKLVVVDIDGTILPDGKNEISENLVEAFKKLHEKGIKILIATGRHFKLIPKSILEDVNPNYVISINGGCLSDKYGNSIKVNPLPRNIYKKLQELCIKNDIALGFKCEDNIKVKSRYQYYLDTYLDNDLKTYSHLVIDETKNNDEITPLGAFIIGNPLVIESFKNEFDNLVIAKSTEMGFDVFMEDVNKSTAIEDALNLLNLKWDNVLACGDAGNDTEMIRKANIGVCMQNALDENLRTIANYVTDSVENDGVAKALRHFNII